MTTTTSDAFAAPVLDAVVKIFTTHCEPDFSLPWQMKPQDRSTASGFILPGRRILTNAHAVDRATVITVKKRGSDVRYHAALLCAGTERDLALLAVPDDAFWTRDLKPLPLGASPALHTTVSVVGYPRGGESLCITAGVVSRVEMQRTVHAESDVLAVQIDAAINEGASGGPALNSRGDVVGVAFQVDRNAENVGYLIEQGIVRHFLTDYDTNGRYTGVCHPGFRWQPTESPAMRKFLCVPHAEAGVLVTRVLRVAPAATALRRWDVVTAVDGVALSNAGTVAHRCGERMRLEYLFSTKFVGDVVNLRILRKGEVMHVSYALADFAASCLVPMHERATPEYLVVGGMLFVALSIPYLVSEFGWCWEDEAPTHLAKAAEYGEKDAPDHQVVVLSQVLSARINVAYEHLSNVRLHKFNGVEVRNLKHLASLVDVCRDDFLTFEVHQELVVLERKLADEATEEIRDTHGIPAAMRIASPEECETVATVRVTGEAGEAAKDRVRKADLKQTADTTGDGDRHGDGDGDDANKAEHKLDKGETDALCAALDAAALQTRGSKEPDAGVRDKSPQSSRDFVETG